jgi:hypothetical protein
MLFIFPFIIYGLWDTNTTTISYIDELLLSFLKNQQNLAKINLEEQNNKFLLNDITPESIKYLAYVRLFTRISPDVLRDEILALKQKASGKKLTILNTSTESNIEIESFPMNNNNNNNMNVVNAAQTIIKVVSATGQDQKETLNELKELQQMMIPDAKLEWSPWFSIFAKSYLPSWWEDLNTTINTDKYVNLNTIYKINM